MRIDVGNNRPLRNRAYRNPLNKRKIIDKAIDERLEAKVIERSQSPWSFPLVVVTFVRRKMEVTECVRTSKHSTRYCKTNFLSPSFDDILSLLGDAYYFTALDLKSDYWLVKLEEDSKKKTPFAYHR